MAVGERESGSGVANGVGRLLKGRGFLGVAGAVLVTLGGALVVGSTALGWGQVTNPGLHFSPRGVISSLYLVEGRIAFFLGLALAPIGTALLFAEDRSLRRALALVAVVGGLVLTGLCGYTLLNIGERTAAFFCGEFGKPGQPGDQFFQQACKTIANEVDARVGLYLALEASIATVVGGLFSLRAAHHSDGGGHKG